MRQFGRSLEPCLCKDMLPFQNVDRKAFKEMVQHSIPGTLYLPAHTRQGELEKWFCIFLCNFCCLTNILPLLKHLEDTINKRDIIVSMPQIIPWYTFSPYCTALHRVHSLHLKMFMDLWSFYLLSLLLIICCSSYNIGKCILLKRAVSANKACSNFKWKLEYTTCKY